MAATSVSSGCAATRKTSMPAANPTRASITRKATPTRRASWWPRPRRLRHVRDIVIEVMSLFLLLIRCVADELQLADGERGVDRVAGSAAVCAGEIRRCRGWLMCRRLLGVHHRIDQSRSRVDTLLIGRLRRSVPRGWPRGMQDDDVDT